MADRVAVTPKSSLGSVMVLSTGLKLYPIDVSGGDGVTRFDRSFADQQLGPVSGLAPRSARQRPPLGASRSADRTSS